MKKLKTHNIPFSVQTYRQGNPPLQSFHKNPTPGCPQNHTPPRPSHVCQTVHSSLGNCCGSLTAKSNALVRSKFADIKYFFCYSN